MTRKNKWQTDETNRGTLTTESAGGNRLAYEKESSNSWKTSHSYKTNHPAFPHTPPPYDPNNNISCIYARNDKGKLLSNTQFPRHCEVSSVYLKLDAGREVLA